MKKIIIGLGVVIGLLLFFVLINHFYHPPKINIASAKVHTKSTPTPTSTPLASSSKTSPTDTPTPTPTPSDTPTPTPVKVDCVGPDKKHFKTTQENCDSFNQAWATPTPT